MVKNEMSLKIQQSYHVSLKIAENSVNKINKESQKKISYYKGLVTFKKLAAEKTLFEARKQCLVENVDALFSKDALEARLKVLENNAKLQRLNWSFVEVDRANPDKEVARRQIAHNRHNTVIYDCNVARASFVAKWAIKEKDDAINYRLKFEEYAKDLYVNNEVNFYEESYEDFYKVTLANHEALKENTKDLLARFMPVVMDTINQAYNATFAYDVREEILALTDEIISDIEALQKEKTSIIYYEIDERILHEQEKEKIDVKEELDNLVILISSAKENVITLEKKISELDIKLKEAFEKRITRKNQEINIDINVNDEKQVNLLKEIKDCFHLASNQVFNKIYHLIKDYVLAICPFFYDYLDVKEKEYEENAKARRNELKSSLDEECQKAFNNEESYLKYLYKKKNFAESVDDINKAHEENVANIKKQLSADFKKIKDDKKARKQEYLEQKANAKIALKVADGNKASELREVTKLYKKEINQGQIKRYIKAIKNYFAAKKLENSKHTSEVIGKTYPKPLSYKHNYEIDVKASKVAKQKEARELNKTINKDFKISRYKKNFSSTTRENVLGYLFLGIWAVGFVIFTLIPIIYTILMVFSNVTFAQTGYSKVIAFSFKSGLTFPSWTGFENAEVLFLKNVDFMFTYVPRFFRSLLFYVPIVVFIGFVLAMLLNSKIKGRTLFRVIYFLPVVIVSGPVLDMLNNSNTSGSSSIRLTLDGSSVAKILESLSPTALKYANEVFQNFIIILWMTGVPIVLFISALQKINKQLYEAAEIDGANKWQTLWAITFPLIKSIMLIVCLFTIMQVTTINVDFVNPINSWLQNKMSTSGYNMGLVSLASWVQTLIVLVFVLVAFLLFREKEFVSKDKNFEEIEEAKRKKEQRKAKRMEFFHVQDIKAFFTKLFAPITKLAYVRKAKKQEKEDR